MKTCLNCLEKLEVKAYIESPAQGLLPCCAGDCRCCDGLRNHKNDKSMPNSLFNPFYSIIVSYFWINQVIIVTF